MAVRALGAGQLVDSEGTWPTNYVNFANEEGILDDVNAIYTATATRLQAATIVVNSLTNAMWKKVGVKSNGEIEWSNEAGETIINNVLKLTLVKNKPCNSVSIKDHEFNGIDVKEGFDLTGIKVGLVYDYYLDAKENEIQGLWIAEDSDLYTVDFTAIGKVTTSKVVLTVDGSEKEYKINNETAYYQNEKAETLAENKSVSGVAYLDDDNVITVIYGELFEHFGVIDEIKSNKVKFDTDADIKVADGFAPADFKINDSDNEYFLTKDGKGMSFDDLAEGDVICYYVVDIVGGKKYVAEVVTDKVEGEVTAIVTTNKTVKIDGKKYDFLTGSNSTPVMPALGDEIVAYLNKAGKVVMFEKVEGVAADVAVVSYYKEYKDKYNWTNADVKLTFTDGKQSEMLSIDVESSIEELFTLTNVKESATADTYDSEEGTSKDYSDVASSSLLGTAVQYEINGDKLTLVDINLADNTDEKYDTAAKHIVVGKRSTYITNNSDAVLYRFTDSTKVFNIKADGTYGMKVEELDVKSLDDTDLTTGIYVGGIDSETKEIEFVFLTESDIKRVTEANFAFVTEVVTVKKDNKTAYEVTVLDMNGEEATYVYSTDEANAGFGKPQQGHLYDITLNGEYIIDGDELPQGTAPNAKTEDYIKSYAPKAFVSDLASKRNEITLENSSLITYSDDVLVVLKDGSKLKLADLSDIEEKDETGSSNMRVVNYFEYKEDADEVAETIVIVIEEVESADIADKIIAKIGTTNYTFEVNGNKITATAKAVGAVANKTLTTGITFVDKIVGDSETNAVLTYDITYNTAEITILDAQN